MFSPCSRSLLPVGQSFSAAGNVTLEQVNGICLSHREAYTSRRFRLTDRRRGRLCFQQEASVDLPEEHKVCAVGCSFKLEHISRHSIVTWELAANSASLIIIPVRKKWEKLDVKIEPQPPRHRFFRELEEGGPYSFPTSTWGLSGKEFLRILQADDKNKIPDDTKDQCHEFSVLVKWFISATPSKS